MKSAYPAAVLVLVAILGDAARAQQPPTQPTAPSPPAGDRSAPPLPTWSGDRSAEAGMFLPLTVSPRTGVQRTVLTVLSGYDSLRGPVMRVATEVNPWGPIVLQAGALYSGAAGLQPRVGLRVQVLRQASHVLDLALGVQYDGASYEGKAGFDVFVALSRQFGRVGLFANLVYGQEMDPSQRHGELRVALLGRLAERLYGGLDTRVAFDLDEGREHDAREVKDVDFVVGGGPTLSYSVGWFSVMVQGGAVGMRYKGSTPQLGASAVGGFAATIM